MQPEQFTSWLRGFIELNGQTPTTKQWQIIKDHLQTVFHKITPVYNGPWIGPLTGDTAEPTSYCSPININQQGSC